MATNRSNVLALSSSRGEPVRLDRLSALLEGLLPRVQLVPDPVESAPLAFEPSQDTHLYLHVVLQGWAQLQVQGRCVTPVEAPALVVCQGACGHALQDMAGAAAMRVMSFKAVFDGPVAPQLMHEFSQPLVIALDTADPSLAQIVQLIFMEVEQPRCGQPALMHRAGDILLIGLLRHLVATPFKAVGLFRGLSDPRIARTLVAMHAEPAGPWTLDALALEAGMSRTSFATQFRAVMNVSAGKYLENLRLAIAHRVVAAGHGMKRAAREAGYASPSTLSRALSRSSQQAAAR